MRLVLLRHGEAEPLRAVDSERALTVRGRDQARATGTWLSSVAGPSCVLVSSTYRRARETANQVMTMLPQAEFAVIDHVTPEDGVRKAVISLERVVRSELLILVTHMPLVSGLAGWLEHGAEREGRPFALAEARLFELDVLGPGQARLIDVFIPAV